MDAALWRKLCWNVPFNGLCIAGHGISTDKIIRDLILSERARTLMDEVQEAAAIEGHIIPNAFIESQFNLTEKMYTY